MTSLLLSFRLVDMAECTQCRQNNMARLTSPEGRIASVVTRESKVQCGSTACPWVVEAKQGQKINVTLLDFGLATREEHASTDVCYMYAVIHEQVRVLLFAYYCHCIVGRVFLL